MKKIIGAFGAAVAMSVCSSVKAADDSVSFSCVNGNGSKFIIKLSKERKAALIYGSKGDVARYNATFKNKNVVMENDSGLTVNLNQSNGLLMLTRSNKEGAITHRVDGSCVELF